MTTPITFDALRDRLKAQAGGARRLVAIAGAPGSGKSTLAERLCASLNGPDPDCCRVLAMDGYHYDDRVLEQRGHRARKGAPHTFDVEGLAAMLARLQADAGEEIAVPVFDRALEIARAGADIIPGATRIVLVEGNYLLLDDPRWAGLRGFFDTTVFIDVPRPEIERRLTARWRGFGFDEAALRAKLEENDLPNADLVIRQSVRPDLLLTGKS